MKKLASLLLSLMIIVAMVPLSTIPSMADEMTATNGYITYSVSNGEATITDVDTSISGDITIPSKVYGYPVTNIGVDAFSRCSSLTSIVIPDSVTRIDSWAFFGCSSLTSITIPNSVTDIGYCTFYGCSSLTSITIPNSVTSIGDSAFEDCSRLTSITIPDSVTSIGNCAFRGCSSLTNISVSPQNQYYSAENGVLFNKNKSTLITCCADKTGSYEIKTSVMSICAYAFENCSSLTSIVIPNSVTSIGSGAFRGCSSLTSIPIPGGVTDIGYYTFYGCSSLTSITIPNSVTSIGDYAFGNCSRLTSITIPDSVTSIGDDAFSRCSSLTSIVIPDSVTSIGNYAFYDCSSLTSIVIPNSVTSIGNYAFFGCSSLTSITIPDSVTSIGEQAFYDCSSLTSIVIPNSVTSIGSGAFRRCSSLTSITIPDSVTSIGNYAFSGCSSLTSITIPNSVTGIGDSAFSGCSSLTSIVIPNSVTSIGDDAFIYSYSFTIYGVKDSYAEKYAANNNISFAWLDNPETYSGYCGEYIHWQLNTGNGELTMTGSGKMNDYNGYNSKTPWYSNKDSIISANISTGITSIGNYAFYGCSSLTSINIPDSVTRIDSWAFFGCSSLTSITIPNSVTGIGDSAFSGCSSLTSIVIPNSVTSIGNGAFNGCNNLMIYCAKDSAAQEYATQQNIQYINISGGGWNFDFDTGFLSITEMRNYTYTSHAPWYELRDHIKAISFSDEITYIGNYAFEDCSSLTSITIPDSVTSIGNSAFSGCSSLTSITIPDGVTSIGDDAFDGCSSLTSITIPDGVTSIGNSAFYGCSSMTSITIPESVTSIGIIAFSGCDNLVIYCAQNSAAQRHATQNNIQYINISGNGWNFDLDTGLLSITEMGSYTITSCAPWYELRDHIKAINFSDEITYIGSYAFYNCYNLTQVTIPESVTSFGEAAFSGCSNLVTVSILGNCKFGHDVFSDCISLQKINIPTGISSLDGAEIFKNCCSLEELFIPKQIKTISDSAFIGCDKLTLTVFNNSYALEYAIANSIPYRMYAGDGINYSFNSEENTLIISGTGAMVDFGKEDTTPWYNYRDSIKKVIISEGVTNIGSSAFAYLPNLSSVKIADTVSEIGEVAFYKCNNLKEIIFGSNITRIATDAFGNCGNILRVYCPSVDKWCEIEFEDANSNPLSCGAMLYIDNKLIRDISIPNGVTSINDYAFFGCPTIRSIIIPEGVVTIGEDAFRNCVGLESVSLPSTLENIGLNAFSCENIKKVYITDLAKWCNINFNNYASNPLHIADVLYLNNEQIIELNIPEGVEIIKSYAFYDFQGCSCLYIPATVTTVQEEAFYFCDFKSIVLQNGLDYYDKLYTTQFSGAHIVIPESVVFIPGNTISSSNVIFGKRGSEAENYALDNGNKFYKTPKSISIYSLPTKTVYYQESNKSDDRYFKSDGLKLLVEYYDGTKEVIDKDYITLGFNIEEYGTQTITVLFGGQITTFEITILSKKITSIAVTTNPTKTKYIIGEDFSMLGMVVTMYFYDGTAEHIKLNSEMITGFDSSKVGIQSLTVSYYGNTATFDVEIIGYISQVNIIIPEPIVGETIPTLFVPKVEILPNNEYDFNLRGYWLSSSDGANYKRTQNGDIFEAGKYYAFYCEESDSHEINEATTWLLNGKSYSTQTIGCDESYIEVCYISEKLEAYVIGDLDGDSELSDWDGVLLARYLAGWNVEIPTLDALDIDGDGEITDWDGVVLDRYLAGWDISIG